MPGILPMKVIKVGSNSQTRIAQACDRCRSKKIRCDGMRPSCTQCVNVGFECKTSDKLSRRAFPRGYTESLEERVRALEAEVRELKLLLDEKDEKIDMLSRIRSRSPKTSTSPKTDVGKLASSTPVESGDKEEGEPDEVFKVLQSPTLHDDENSDAYFMGNSSGKPLVEAFKHKLQSPTRTSFGINTESFFSVEANVISHLHQSQAVCWKAPARLVSDQLVNVFFQEWAPLFPVLHRPAFLSVYERYVSNPEAMEDRKSLAQLHLVFSIAALSSNSYNLHDIESFEGQWRAALEDFLMDNTITTLQCLVLAQIYCLQNADHTRLLKYRSLATGLSHRLGLHLSQKRFALGELTSEMRKKVFWSLYTLDCFCAAQLGLPMLLNDEDVHCEYPTNIDDEYVTEKGFLPTLPGEFTKLSSAIALFKLSRVLALVLRENYPALTSYDLSFKKISMLTDALESWSTSLPKHLRLAFEKDKPSTGVISSRSPLLSLAYHYTRSLIFRPIVCASSALSEKAGPATVILADSSKHLVQIVQLLEERNLAFSFCLNRNRLLILAGFGLLFQTLALDRDGALFRDNSALVTDIARMLDHHPSPASMEFRRVSGLLSEDLAGSRASSKGHGSDSEIQTKQNQSRNNPFKSLKSRLTSPASKSTTDLAAPARRATICNLTSSSQTSLLSAVSEPSPILSSSGSCSSFPIFTRSEPALPSNESRHIQQPPPPAHFSPPTDLLVAVPSTNLDFLPLGSTPSAPSRMRYFPPRKDLHPGQDWERLLTSLDQGSHSIYDGIYASAAPPTLHSDSAPTSAAVTVCTTTTGDSPADFHNLSPPSSASAITAESPDMVAGAAPNCWVSASGWTAATGLELEGAGVGWLGGVSGPEEWGVGAGLGELAFGL